MAAILGNALALAVIRLRKQLPSLGELVRSMNSDSLIDGSRYF